MDVSATAGINVGPCTQSQLLFQVVHTMSIGFTTHERPETGIEITHGAILMFTVFACLPCNEITQTSRG